MLLNFLDPRVLGGSIASPVRLQGVNGFADLCGTNPVVFPVDDAGKSHFWDVFPTVTVPWRSLQVQLTSEHELTACNGDNSQTPVTQQTNGVADWKPIG